MVRNADNEELMQRTGNPSHLDWGGNAVPAFWLRRGLAAVAPRPGIDGLDRAACGGVGLWVRRLVAAWFERRAWARWCFVQDKHRVADFAETDRRIRSMHGKTEPPEAMGAEMRSGA